MAENGLRFHGDESKNYCDYELSNNNSKTLESAFSRIYLKIIQRSNMKI